MKRNKPGRNENDSGRDRSSTNRSGRASVRGKGNDSTRRSDGYGSRRKSSESDGDSDKAYKRGKSGDGESKFSSRKSSSGPGERSSGSRSSYGESGDKPFRKRSSESGTESRGRKPRFDSDEKPVRRGRSEGSESRGRGKFGSDDKSFGRSGERSGRGKPAYIKSDDNGRTFGGKRSSFKTNSDEASPRGRYKTERSGDGRRSSDSFDKGGYKGRPKTTRGKGSGRNTGEGWESPEEGGAENKRESFSERRRPRNTEGFGKENRRESSPGRGRPRKTEDSGSENRRESPAGRGRPRKTEDSGSENRRESSPGRGRPRNTEGSGRERGRDFSGGKRPGRTEDSASDRRRDSGTERRNVRSEDEGFDKRKSRFSEGREKSSDTGRRRRSEGSEYTPRKRKSIKSETIEESTGAVRLNRFLANAGICSRREADTFISTGVVKVNDQIVTEMGYKVQATDVVRFHDRVLRREKPVYILMNKPKDYLTTTHDPEKRKTVMDLLKNSTGERVVPVGRLDRNTTGVLLLTNDGDLAQKLMHPKFHVKKVYQAELDKKMEHSDLEKIADGLELEDGPVNVDAVAYADPSDKRIIGLEIHSGRNRIVRRIFEHLGYNVEKLDRVSYANLTKKDLKRGEWRYLSEQEVLHLRRGSGKKKPKQISDDDLELS